MLHFLRGPFPLAVARAVRPVDGAGLGHTDTDLTAVLAAVAHEATDIVAFGGIPYKEPELQLRILRELFHDMAEKRRSLSLKPHK